MNPNRICLAAAAAALTVVLTAGCSSGAAAGTATAPAVRTTATAPAARMLTLAEGTVIGGQWPIMRMMPISEAQALPPKTPICFWSRAQSAAVCGTLRTVDAAGAAVDLPPGGVVAPKVHDLVFLLNDHHNSAVLGHIHRIDAAGFTVLYLEKELAAMGGGVQLALAPESTWNR